MRMKYLQTFIAILFVTISISGFSQEIKKNAVSLVTVTDSLKMRGYIFDDDTKTPVLDKEKKPVLDAYGKPKTAARVQFKELIGLSFVFRF
jgi:hypothetical protein